MFCRAVLIGWASAASLCRCACSLLTRLLSAQVSWLSKEWARRAALPSHVVTMLDNFPTNLHPMSQFSAAITALNSESSFARAYSEGVNKAKYWEVRGFGDGEGQGFHQCMYRYFPLIHSFG